MGAILTSLARRLFITSQVLHAFFLVGVPILDPLKKVKAFNWNYITQLKQKQKL